MTHKDYITIEGYSFKEVKKSLEDWINLYAGKMDTSLTFEVLEKGKSNYCVSVNGEIDNHTFNFLVNYLVYPENINLNSKVRGYTTIKNKNIFPEEELEKRVVIFIPKEDKEYDNVYASTGDGKTFIVDFGGKTKEVDFLITFEEPDLSEYSKTEYSIKPKPEKSNKGNEEIQEDLTKLFLYFYVPAFIITISLFEQTKYTYYSLAFLGVILSLWIAKSHKFSLKKNGDFILFLVLSSLVGGIAILYDDIISKEIDSMIAIAFFHPFWMLICYKIFRPIYIMIFKKEPKFDRNSWKLKTWFYTVILIMIPIFISFYINENYLDYESIKPKQP